MDAYVIAKNGSWRRLEELAGRRKLSGREADEMMGLYEAASTDLSIIRSIAPNSPQSARLSGIIGRARTRFTGVQGGAFAGIGRFFVSSFPVTVYRLRWTTLWIAVAFVALVWAVGAWVASDPSVQNALGSPDTLRALARHDFVDYYSNNPAGAFALGVWSNNAWLAAQVIALGITGFFVPYSLLQNAVNVGINAGVLFSYGYGGTFFAYILPHGIPEMTCVFIASAAGLKIFWAWVAPGPRSRAAALAQEGRSLITAALGLALVLALSGLVEAFVTPSGLPAVVKIGIGVVFFCALWTYVLVLGRRAAAAGETGDLSPSEAGEQEIAAG
nr:stage II sporulation protein M [Spelaeicoccus albus]